MAKKKTEKKSKRLKTPQVLRSFTCTGHTTYVVEATMKREDEELTNDGDGFSRIEYGKWSVIPCESSNFIDGPNGERLLDTRNLLSFIKSPKDYMLPDDSDTNTIEVAKARAWAFVANYKSQVKVRIRPVTVNYSYEFLLDDEKDCIEIGKPA